MSNASKLWLHGLGAAFIASMASAFEMAIVLPIAAPTELNFDHHLGKLVLIIVGWSLLQGVKSAFTYLKQSPLPPDEPMKVEVNVHTDAAAGGK